MIISTRLLTPEHTVGSADDVEKALSAYDELRQRSPTMGSMQ